MLRIRISVYLRCNSDVLWSCLGLSSNTLHSYTEALCSSVKALGGSFQIAFLVRILLARDLNIAFGINLDRTLAAYLDPNANHAKHFEKLGRGPLAGASNVYVCALRFHTGCAFRVIDGVADIALCQLNVRRAAKVGSVILCISALPEHLPCDSRKAR